MVKCPACDGTGFETLDFEIPCAACGNTGNVYGSRCPSCGGKGNLNTDSKIICEVCKGTGQLKVVKPLGANQESRPQ